MPSTNHYKNVDIILTGVAVEVTVEHIILDTFSSSDEYLSLWFKYKGINVQAIPCDSEEEVDLLTNLICGVIDRDGQEGYEEYKKSLMN